MKIRFYQIGLSLLLCALVVGCDDKSGGKSATKAPADDGSADVAKGMASLEKQDFRAAATSFAAAAGKCATNFEARLQLALVDIRLGEVAGAHAAATNAVELCPESAEARLVAGQACYLKKDYKAALSQYAAVAGESSLPAVLRSSALVGRGVVEMAQNAYDTARISFLRAMRLNRRNAAAWYHLGLLSRNTYNYDEAALEQFEMAARFFNPHEERAKKISREIIPALRAAVVAAAAAKPGVAKRNPGAAAKLLAEGESLQKKKMIRAAIKKYEAAYASDPLSEAAALKYAELLALNDRTSAGVDKALAAYRAAIDQRPEKQSNYLAAARLAYENKRWATAAAIMGRAVAHDPENLKTLDLLIASLQKCGKSRQAEEWKSYRAEIK